MTNNTINIDVKFFQLNKQTPGYRNSKQAQPTSKPNTAGITFQTTATENPELAESRMKGWREDLHLNKLRFEALNALV